MERNYNPYFRLQTYLNYFGNQEGNLFEELEQGATIEDIHKRTGIPLAVIRKDISVIVGYEGNLQLNVDEESQEYADFCIQRNMKEDWTGDIELLQKIIIEGSADQLPFIYDKMSDIMLELNLSAQEFQALMSWKQQNLINDNYRFPFVVKENYRFSHKADYGESLEKIHNAFVNDQKLQLTYTNKSNKSRTMKINPLKLVYDSIDNEYALLIVERNELRALRLSAISDLMNLSEKRDISPKDTAKLTHLEQVWGLNFTGKPYKVKLRFYNEGNVWEKVRRDLSYRTKGKIYEDSGYLYYEDIVYGLDSFKSWVFSYGSSVIVEEPVELRKKIINSLKRRATKILI